MQWSILLLFPSTTKYLISISNDNAVSSISISIYNEISYLYFIYCEVSRISVSIYNEVASSSISIYSEVYLFPFTTKYLQEGLLEVDIAQGV